MTQRRSDPLAVMMACLANHVTISFPPVGSEAGLTLCASCEWRVDP
jgi:hypothetical protein